MVDFKKNSNKSQHFLANVRFYTFPVFAVFSGFFSVGEWQFTLTFPNINVRFYKYLKSCCHSPTLKQSLGIPLFFINYPRSPPFFNLQQLGQYFYHPLVCALICRGTEGSQALCSSLPHGMNHSSSLDISSWLLSSVLISSLYPFPLFPVAIWYLIPPGSGVVAPFPSL